MEIRIGCDPELFVFKDGYPVSAHGLIPGTKKHPHVVNRGSVQVDGMALEIGIDPSDSYSQFINSITLVTEQMLLLLPEGYELSGETTVTFSEEEMAAQPFEAVQLGCDPDYDAYTGKENAPPVPHPLMRAAGGHVHIGWTEGLDPKDPQHFEMCRSLARNMDAYVGCMSVINDDNIERRQMYGQPGAFRPKPYGMEYRTLSNFWLFDQNAAYSVYFNTLRATKALFDNHGREAAGMLGETDGMPKAQYAILKSSHEVAYDVMRQLGLDT